MGNDPRMTTSVMKVVATFLADPGSSATASI